MHVPSRLRSKTSSWLLALAVTFSQGAPTYGLEIFAVGMDTPETISIAPAGFGDFGGHLFVPEPGPAEPDLEVVAGNSKIWTIASEGGEASFFATLAEGLGLGFRGGMFLPPDFGEFGGQYVTIGVREFTAWDEHGQDTPFVTTDTLFFDNRVFRQFVTPVIAPDDFGELAGKLLVSYLVEDIFDPGGVLAIEPNADASHFVTPSVADFFDPRFEDNVFEPFGLAFAPADFGQFGGKLLVSDSGSHNIAAVDSQGTFEPFAKVPLETDQQFLRQMAVSPTDFGNLGELLFVSVAGSQQGGGTLGSVHAIASDGQVIASLNAGDGIGRLDPRGLTFTDDGRLFISDAANGFLYLATPEDFEVAVALQAGDADRDFDFDQFDLIQVLLSEKYLTGEPATWGEGDWNGAPGGNADNPPVGNGLYDQFDIVSALAADIYLSGSYLALDPQGQSEDSQTSIGYDAQTGEIWVDAPAGRELTSINIDSAGGIFTGRPAENLGGSFDNDADNNVFKATFGAGFGALSFGSVAQPGLAEQFLLEDLTVVGSLSGGGGLGEVDLIYVPVPEPATLLQMALGLLALLTFRQRIRRHLLRI